MSQPEILWSPSERAIEEAQVTQFARQMVRKHRLELNTYPDFHRWTVDNPEIFWNEVWDFCGVIASRKGSTVLVDGDKMPGARWFPEARLNIAENLLRRGDRGDALVFWDESGLRRRVSYSDLTSDVSRAVQALLGIGLRAGDRAAAFIPNLPETSMLALAALSQGIVWSSCSPDFGVDGVIDRFGQIEPKVLFCADGYRYNGQTHDSLERVREIAERLPTRAQGGGGSLSRPGRRRVRHSRRRCGSTNGCAATSPPTSLMRSCRSITRCSCCSLPAPPASRSASCTAPAARCCSR